MEISDTVDTKLSIGTKSIDDVERFLREHDHIVDVFKALCLVQIANDCDCDGDTHPNITLFIIKLMTSMLKPRTRQKFEYYSCKYVAKPIRPLHRHEETFLRTTTGSSR